MVWAVVRLPKAPGLNDDRTSIGTDMLAISICCGNCVFKYVTKHVIQTFKCRRDEHTSNGKLG